MYPIKSDSLFLSKNQDIIPIKSERQSKKFNSAPTKQYICFGNHTY